MFRNQDFCYWLQGYFELSQHASLTQRHIELIDTMLNAIDEAPGSYTAWLGQVVYAIKQNHYHQPIIDFFASDIKDQLNSIFEHVIDTSYVTPYSSSFLHAVHTGTLKNDEH